MALRGFQYEPGSLSVNEACFEEEHVKNQGIVKVLQIGGDVGNET